MAARVTRYSRVKDGKYEISVEVPFSAVFNPITTNPATGLVGDGLTYDDQGTKKFSAHYAEWKDKTNPTIPTARGAAAIVLCPGKESNWLPVPKGDTLASFLSADNTPEGTIVPPQVETYVVTHVNLKLTPFANVVNVEDVMEGVKESYEKEAQRLDDATPKDQRKGARKDVRAAPRQDDRNANVDTTQNTVFGTVVKTIENPEGRGTNDYPFYLTTYPSSYRGIIQYYVSFIDNPNTIWSMTDVDLRSGPNMWSTRSVEMNKGFNVYNPYMVELKTSVTEGDKTSVDQTRKEVNVHNTDASWGAFVIYVEKMYQDAVFETWSSASGSQILTPKGVIQGVVEYDIVFSVH